MRSDKALARTVPGLLARGASSRVLMDGAPTRRLKSIGVAVWAHNGVHRMLSTATLSRCREPGTDW